MAKLWEPTETLRPEEVTISLQRPRQEEHVQQFQVELNYWFPALKWLIKEFRLHIGYETPDEEAGVRFWLEHFSRRKSSSLAALEPSSWLWPTADEPVMRATKLEVHQARTWKLPELESAMKRFFDLRRRLCPQTPILVPLKELRLHPVQTQHSTTPEQMRLHLKEARSRSHSATGRTRCRAKAVSLEVRERLYPKSPARHRHAQLPDEIFMSRLIDVAIASDGDPTKVGEMNDSARWSEGLHSLEELKLVNFWQRLQDKESLALGCAPGRVLRLVQERLSCKALAERISEAFFKKFGYETLDMKILFNFWISMPSPVRSAAHVRGHPDREVLRSLEEFLRLRKEGKLQVEGKIERRRSGAVRPWRPGGESIEVCDSLPPAPITPRGRRGGLALLSKPRVKAEAVHWLQALAQRFKKDPVMRRMLKQCLQGLGGTVPGGAADLLESKVLKDACPDKTPRAAEGKLQGRRKLQDPPGQNQGSLNLWLDKDSERAGRFVNLLREMGLMTQKMWKHMQRRARELLKKGARLTTTGPLLLPRSTDPDLPPITPYYIVEDEFAQLCRRFGAHEAYVRFGPMGQYLLDTSQADTDMNWFKEEAEKSLHTALGGATPGKAGDAKVLKRASSFHSIVLGGAVIECPTQDARCKASSGDPSKALEQTGWHPQMNLEEFHGGSWWQLDFARWHSFSGLRLQWSIPQFKEVHYETRFALRSDLKLRGGLGHPIVVEEVNPGGPAFLAGVQPGDVLHLEDAETDILFLQLPAMAALAQLQEQITQPLRLLFKARELLHGLAKLQQKTKVTLKVDKGQGFEEIRSEEIQVSELPCVVPGFFVAGRVRVEFGAWPQCDGKALGLSVGVLKVWRLAPPLFRQQFMSIFRSLERKAKKASLPVQPVQRFWCTASLGQSFNMVINMDLVRRHQRSHDFRGDEHGALLKMAVKDKKEFHVLRGDEAMALRLRIFDREEDARECTFHPQTAANVPHHVLAERDRISERMDPEKITSIKDFVQEIGTNYEGPKYRKYRHVYRRRMLSIARGAYVKGDLRDAMSKLKSSFGVQQILDRFRCHHQGCGQKLDTNQNIKKCDRCSGFYCAKHKSTTVHRCQVMKEIIKAKAKKEQEENGEGDRLRPPEENFDNKVEFGLLLEARDLAEDILSALKKKEKEKDDLEYLGQSLASFGAVRLSERPFRRQLCEKALLRRHQTCGVRMGADSHGARDFHCECSRAHSPAELRFPAAESVHRRVAWVKEAYNQAASRADVRPNSAAERTKMKKAEDDRKKAPPPPPLPNAKGGPARQRRDKSQTRLQDKAMELQHAFGLCCEAQVKLEESNAGEAELKILEAKKMAEDCLREARASEGRRSEKAGEKAHHSQKQELQQMRVSVHREARETLELCDILEAEVKSMRQLPPPPPPWSPPESPKAPKAPWKSPGKSHSPVATAFDDAALTQLLLSEPSVSETRKTLMCLDYLEVGICSNTNCPFAHSPDELQGYGSFQSRIAAHS